MSHQVPPLKLNLYNFEDVQYEDSKYVLTSPRSLEACAKLDVKPVDLLYKPLSEYQEELLPQDIPLRTIFNIYDEQEQARQTKLQLCRKERSRIIEEERHDRIRGRSRSLERPSSARGGRAQKCIKITKSYSDDDLCAEKLQRKRTAWATSLGHKRLTHKELEQRAKELHEESERLRKALLARKEGTSERQSRSRKIKSASPTSSLPRPRSASVSRLSNFSDSWRSRSVSRLSSPTIEQLPPRDLRIIEIMTAKREEDRALSKLRRKAELAWERERKLEKESRNDAERRRRKLLGSDQKKKTQTTPKKSNAVLLNEKLRQKDIQWRSSYLKQLHSKEQKMTDKKIKDQLRNRVQKKNLELNRMNEKSHIENLQRKQDAALRKSEIRRDNLLHSNNKKNLLSNMNDKKIHQINKNITNQSLVEDLDKSRLLSDLRHSRAKSNYSQVLDSQYRSMHILQKEREKRQEKARQSISKMDADMESWRNQIMKERKRSDNYAENVVSKVNEMKSLRAHNSRLAKEIEHKQNMKRIEADEEASRYEAIMDMVEKERKMDIVQRQKDIAVEQMRATAKITESLRDSVRKKYDTDTFDKKVREAEIFANLGKRSRSQARKNCSSVEIC